MLLGSKKEHQRLSQLVVKRKEVEVMGKFTKEWWKIENEIDELAEKLWPTSERTPKKIRERVKKTEWNIEKMKHKAFKSFWENPENWKCEHYPKCK